MITLIVKFVIKPVNFLEFVYQTAFLQDSSRAESGCIIYETCKHPDEKHGLVFIEVFDSPAALERHKGYEHFTKWKDLTSDMIISKEVTRYDS